MTRDELIEMVRTEIRSLAYETLRTSSQKSKEDERSRTYKPKGLSEEDVEKNIFYGGGGPEDTTSFISTTINESAEGGLPKINSSEIAQFEDSFEEMLKEIDGASVVFDKQANGYSMKVSIDKDGIEAGASGVIEMGSKGKLDWSYSLKSGLHIKSDNLNIDKGNKLVAEKLFNHYDAWQKDWREKLTITPSEPSVEAPMPDAPAPEAGAEAAPEAGLPGEETPAA